jgi:hypothetical protein
MRIASPTARVIHRGEIRFQAGRPISIDRRTNRGPAVSTVRMASHHR